MATKDDVLPNGVKVKKGWVIYYVSEIMHRNPLYFDRPEEFLPERFEKVSNGCREDNQHPSAYIPFHYGPRMCMGKEMAYEEARIFLATLFQRGLRFRLRPGFEPEVKEAIILTSKTGMWMKRLVA